MDIIIKKKYSISHRKEINMLRSTHNTFLKIEFLMKAVWIQKNFCNLHCILKNLLFEYLTLELMNFSNTSNILQYRIQYIIYYKVCISNL